MFNTKRIFLLAVFAFSAMLIHAQIDSFMVEGSGFKFETPTDWVLESKADGIQSGVNWNISLNYGIKTEKLSAEILVRVENRNIIDTFHYKKNRNRVKYDSKLITENGFNIVKTTSLQSKDDDIYNCYDCPKIKNEFWAYPISDSLSLILAFYGTAQQHVLDSLFSVFDGFAKFFFIANDHTIRQYLPFSNPSKDILTDSFSIRHNYLKFHYYSGWINETFAFESSNNCLFKKRYKNISKINLVNICIIILDTPFVLNNSVNKNLDEFKIHPDYLNNDTINHFKCRYYARKLPETTEYNKKDFPYQYEITYFITVYDGFGNDFTLCFSLTEATKKGLDFIYYQEFLKAYIADFIKTNNLFVTIK
jgi:hypothetical protein